jgi:hypothetical protein
VSLPFIYHERPSTDLGLRDVSACRHFVAHSDALWFVRLVDDTCVNVAKLQTMFDSLRQVGDPRATAIIKGHCIDYRPFLNGGSGFLFSRRAAELFAAEALEWFRQMRMPEDCHFGVFLERIGLTPSEATSKSAVGHSWQPGDWEFLRTRNYSIISVCSQERHWQISCQPFSGKFADLVFVHDNYHKVEFATYSEVVNRSQTTSSGGPIRGFQHFGQRGRVRTQ